MKHSIALLLTIGVLSCSENYEVFPTENTETEEAAIETDIPSELPQNDINLFLSFKDASDSHIPGELFTVDISELITQAFNESSNRENPHPFYWIFKKFLIVTDEYLSFVLIGEEDMDLTSYLVAIDSAGRITNFEPQRLGDEIYWMGYSSNEIVVTGRDLSQPSLDFHHKSFKWTEEGYVEQNYEGYPNSLMNNFEYSYNDINNKIHVHIYSPQNDVQRVIIDLYADNRLFFRLPSHIANSWIPDLGMDEEVIIKSKDYNSDGFNDLFIMIPAVTGLGPDGVIPFETHSIYFQDPHGLYQNFYEIDAEIFEIKDNEESIFDLCSRVKENGGFLMVQDIE